MNRPKKDKKCKDKVRIKNLCVDNEKVNNLNIRKTLFLPHINVPQTIPTASDLAIDNLTGNLYYSNGKDWYLLQPTREVFNGNINEQGTGDYLSLNSFFDLFQGSPTGFGISNLSLEPGIYNLNRNDILFRINQLNISGDLRDISGISYVNGKRANLNNQPLLGKSGSNTELLFDNDTVTIKVEELDLTKISLVPGDQVYIFSAVTISTRPDPTPALDIYTIKSVKNDKIILTTKLSDKILSAYADGALSPSITFCPNRIIETDVDTNFIFNILLKARGIWFRSKNNTQNIFNKTFECNNCLLNSSIFANEGLVMKNSSQIVPNKGQNILWGLRTKVNTVLEGAFIISEKIGGVEAIDSKININNTIFLVYQFYMEGGGKGIIWLQNCTSDSHVTSGKIDQGFIPVIGGFDPSQTTGIMIYIEKGSRIGLFQDIRCENVSGVLYVTDESKISIYDFHLKFDLKMMFKSILWYAEKNSNITIRRDTYNFVKFNSNIYEATSNSIIEIKEGEYIKNPPGVDFTYKSEEKSSIYFDLEESKRWPGNIIETSGGKVFFKPTADFTFTPNTGSSPLEVKFTNLSTSSPTSQIWEFGDGSESNEVNPTHIYQNPGNYTIKLTVSNIIDDSFKESKLVVN